MCSPALCRLGRREQVVQSLEWGLARFERAGRITTTIFNRRFPRDVYAYASDSLPMLLWALQCAGAEHLVERHRELLTRELQRFHDVVFDPELGVARRSSFVIDKSGIVRWSVHNQLPDGRDLSDHLAHLHQLA